MNSKHAVIAFTDAHPQWKHMKDRLTTREQDGWQLIMLSSLNIGRVKIEGRTILAELLINYQRLGE